MKRIIISLIVMVVALAGCQQRQEQKQGQGQGPVAYPGGMAPLITPQQIAQLEQIAKANSNNKDGWIALGNALMDVRRFGEAVDAYQKSLALDPNNVDVRVDMGTCLRGIGQSDKALAEYRKAMKINPNHLNAHRNAGVVLAFDLNKPAEAIKEFEIYLKLSPGAPDAQQIRQTIQELKTRQ